MRRPLKTVRADVLVEDEQATGFQGLMDLFEDPLQLRKVVSRHRTENHIVGMFGQTNSVDV